MSFGLTDYSASNFDMVQKPDDTKKTAKVDQTNTDENSNENSNDSEKFSKESTKLASAAPIIKNDVTTYKDGGEPSMLDFGLFDYKHNQKYNPDAKNNTTV